MEKIIKVGIDLAPKSEKCKIIGNFTDAMFAKDYETWTKIFRSARTKAAKSNEYILITTWSGDYLYLYENHNNTVLKPVAFVKSENGMF